MNKTILLTAGILTAFTAASQERKPNIVIFVADDAGMDFGCYGNKSVRTPNIDALAARGVRFDNTFVTSPQSSPSRTAMLTGMFAHTLGVEDLGTPIDSITRIVPSYLSTAGYYTGAMCKIHMGNYASNQFDYYFNGRTQLYAESLMTDKNVFFQNYCKFLDKKGNMPFFLWVGFIDPHRPYKEKNTTKIHDPKKVEVAPFLIDAPDTRQDIADYYDEIYRLDQHVGFMIAELAKRGELDNTVIIFVSDNGLPFVRGKAFLYESGIHVPLIVSWPKKTPQGSVHSNGLSSTIDIAPTVLEIAGVEKPDDMQGESMVPLLLDPSVKGRDVIFSERNHHDTEAYMRCIRTEQYKLIYNAYPYKLAPISADMHKAPSWWDLMKAKQEGTLNADQSYFFIYPRPQIELYDIKNDPNEFHNLAYDVKYYDVVRSLLTKLRNWQKETNDTDWWEREKDDAVDRTTGHSLMQLKPRK